MWVITAQLSVIILCASHHIYPLLFQPSDNRCGAATLSAVGTGGKLSRHKDETGLMLATCRHGMILKALDMYRGEVFEYPYLLLVSYFIYDRGNMGLKGSGYNC